MHWMSMPIRCSVERKADKKWLDCLAHKPANKRMADYRVFSKRKVKEPSLPNWDMATILYPILPHLSARRFECTNRFKTNTAFRL